jgi:hypothetical protein
MEINSYREKLEVPSKSNSGITSKILLAVIDWMNTEDQTLKFTCKSTKEANSVASSIIIYKKKYDCNYVVYRRNYEVYVIKA